MTTKRMAIFVEGQTEITFVRRLLQEMVGEANVIIIEERKERGYFTLQKGFPNAGERYEVLAVNCGNDEEVATSIRDRYDNLVAAGYGLVIGLRDLYPKGHLDYQKLQDGINAGLPAGPAPCFVVVALTEVEAWFLQEQNHFLQVSPILDRQCIIDKINYDIDNDIAEDQVKPSKTLNSIYSIAGKRYTKKKYHVSNIVWSLDMENLYLDRRAKLTSFDRFVALIESFL